MAPATSPWPRAMLLSPCLLAQKWVSVIRKAPSPTLANALVDVGGEEESDEMREENFLVQENIPLIR